MNWLGGWVPPQIHCLVPPPLLWPRQHWLPPQPWPLQYPPLALAVAAARPLALCNCRRCRSHPRAWPPQPETRVQPNTRAISANANVNREYGICRMRRRRFWGGGVGVGGGRSTTLKSPQGGLFAAEHDEPSCFFYSGGKLVKAGES